MTPVEEILKKDGIYYKQSGKDFVVRCFNPEHDDSNPSMRIDKLTGVYHCFSCGHKGNLLGDKGIDQSSVGILREKLKEKIRRMRSVLGMEMPEHYTLFNKSWRGISAETFNKFQAFYHTDPRYRGRVNFPIRDNSGRILVIQGRDEGNTLKQKYLFTPADAKIPLFPTVQPIQGKIILVEGIFDMLNLHDKGLTNAVCCFGTHHFTKAKLNLLKVSGVTGIDVVFDADDSGKKAAEKIRKIVEDFPIRVVNLKKGDPAELAEQQVKNLRRKLYE